MRNLHNIEKSAFRRGEYIGYARGVWRIVRTDRPGGKWLAWHRDRPDEEPKIRANTLAEISERLA